jgi:sporulation protein YlmC with PRC-barrel domain
MTVRKTHSLIATNHINGSTILSDSGEKIGTVDHLVLDAVNGKIAYAVVAFGGFMGLGEHSYSIPWGSVRFNPEENVFVTHVTLEQLKSAPDRPNHWHGDREWEERIFDHFGVPPYWL